ncbi:UDP-3-O-(3-hydroxymyristoyl)glucosamine N-acyltransferase [cf. Phormidesmis sp. LEGE 11477]|uniref:UDP-3-O-(3-hydroxymyristoyl)glucosamine N-acyltransferase n=1 Tax=cf. Phormidesmis sp. LEGE 11477 TaxID=1828680 RepID=UPI00187F4DA9|nr:UDP-3-O-(3-hydroxymyristoyl)glucosamine N-acyltransferase [cf. Phormidesmis sp. LEGE 11477]MBE9063903.1 UDP-3-O-(3-hydroxymyristoyl)glucosamine N-acyltransferase [cf. Phormidesmis sp. LEGE 11477]
MKFSQIVAALGDQVTASSLVSSNLDSKRDVGDRTLTGLAAIQEATANDLSYVEGAKFVSYISTTQAGALILPNDEALQVQASDRDILWIGVKDPRLAFARAINYFYQPYRRSAGIHPSAVIEVGAQIGDEVAIGPLAVVHSGAKVGDRACIHAGAVVYPDATIGQNTVLHANCVVHERTQIGDNCVIHSGAVIGSEGFGFVPTATGWEKMHQSGVAVLEEGVEIGCNSTVDRAAVGETRIGKNTKIDNMVHIAHSCQIGEAVAMAAQVGMAGGTIIGNRVILAGQVGIANKAKIGDGAIASAQAGISSNVAPGEIVSGSPALPHKIFLKSSAIIRRLPEIAKSVKQMQKQLIETND